MEIKQQQKTENYLNRIINIKRNTRNNNIININNMEPKFIGKAKLSRQGQITLPFEARQDLNINLNSELYWYEFNDCLIIIKDLVNQNDLISMVLDKKKGGKK